MSPASAKFVRVHSGLLSALIGCAGCGSATAHRIGDAGAQHPTRGADADAASAPVPATDAQARPATPDATSPARDAAVDAARPALASADASLPTLDAAPVKDASPQLDASQRASCSSDHGGCDVLTSCNDSGGKVVCGACPSGYDGDGVTGCSDIDECLTNNGGCTTFETCMNVVGGGPSCVDKDECAVGHGGCDPLTTCTDQVANTPLCGPCPAYYDGDGYSGCVLSSGSTRWVTTITDLPNNASDQYAFAVSGARDGSGFVVAGRYDFAAVFAPGTPQQRTLANGPYDGGSVTDANAYLARYDRAGTLIWVARTHDYYNAQQPDAIAAFTGAVMLSDGTSVVTGYHGDGCYSGCTTILGLGEANETVLTNTYTFSGSAPEVLVARYAADGKLLWARSADGDDYDRAYRVAALADDSVVIVGRFSGTTTFGKGEPHQTTLAASAQLGGFIARYLSDGSLAWARQTTGSCWTQIFSVAALPNDRGVVIGGSRGGNARGGCDLRLDENLASEKRLDSFNANNAIADYDPFIARLGADGSAIWIQGVRSDSSHSSQDSVDALAVTSAGMIFATGSYSVPMRFAAGTPQEVLLSGTGGTFLASLDLAGTLAWARHVGGFTSTIGTNLALDDAEHPIMTGEFQTSETFGLGEANQTMLVAPDCYVGGYSAASYAASYTPSGDLRWVRGWPCSSARAIAVIAGGPLISVGSYWQQTTLGPGEPHQTTVTAAQLSDGIVVAFQP